ncbi:YCF48-related protein [Gallaecimonas sp. GXIMD4217]|uniref:WD40/YVTN/BNR-like repeat-containing protein n=1 Tax=Gallaecimonas sp. GXIMD4217 TaxID=3131927 RepID=UPI00311B049F
MNDSRVWILGLALLCKQALAADPLNTPAYPAERLDRVLFADITQAGDKLVAVGDRGVIVKGDDAGWQQQMSPVASLLTKVSFLDASTGFAVGHDATILQTRDGGVSWQIRHREPELQRPLLDVLFLSEHEGIAIGAYGLFLRTTDGGASWQRELHQGFLSADDQAYLDEVKESSEEDYRYELDGMLPHLNAVARDGQGRLLLAGEMGLVALSEDDGKSWQRLDSGYQGSFFTVTAVDDGQWLVGGLRGNLYRSDDNGNSWNRLRFDGQATINSLDRQANGQILMTGNDGSVFVSHDGGYFFLPLAREVAGLTLAAQQQGNTLVVATEQGIKTLSTDNKETP